MFVLRFLDYSYQRSICKCYGSVLFSESTFRTKKGKVTAQKWNIDCETGGEQYYFMWYEIHDI